MKKLSLILGWVAAMATSAFASEARLQVIHNAADPAAANVDIYVNGGLYEGDFEFREATEFRTVPAGVELNIGIAGGGSSSVDDTITSFKVTLEDGKRYVVVANGVLDPSMFAANPNAEPIGFTLFAYDKGREKAKWWFLTDLVAFHGATDAPAVDVRIRKWEWGALFKDLSYGEFSYYRSVFPIKYILDVTLAGQPDAVVESYEADLSGLRGGAAVVFASGFLSPDDNKNGEAFGLFAALPNGAVVQLPAISKTARLQVIHNAADPAAASVDVYVNGGLYEGDFEFREATEFRTVPAGVELNIGIAGGGSASVDDTITSFKVTLEAGKTYVAFANGVLDPSAFADNPGGKSIGFTLIARDNIKEKGYFTYTTQIIAFHGATDAPAVDIYARRAWWKNRRLVSNLSYGEFSDYRRLRPRKYTLSVTPAGQPNTVVAKFEADLNGLGGGAAVVFASGFLTPGDNQNGEAFGLYVALPDGTVIGLPAAAAKVQRDIASVDAAEAELPRSFALNQNYPNPFNPQTTINFALPAAAQVRLDVFNVLGQQVRTLVNDRMEAGEHSVTFDASRLPSGVYFYRVQAGSETLTKQMTLLK